jgi:hypothetical protein
MLPTFHDGPEDEEAGQASSAAPAEVAIQLSAAVGAPSSQPHVSPLPLSAAASSPSADIAAPSGDAADTIERLSMKSTLSPPPNVHAFSPVSQSRRYSRASQSPGGGITGLRRLSRQHSTVKTKITESWPGSHHIRRLFRLFDKDGNGKISPSEFRAGLQSLGFDVTSASDLSILHAQLDKDKTGSIRESQFIHVFRSLNRAAIEAKLKAGAQRAASLREKNAVHTHCQISMVKIGHERRENLDDVLGGGRREEVSVSFHHDASIPVDQLADRLRKEEEDSWAEINANRAPAIRWIDIVASMHSPITRTVLDLVSNFYLLPHECLGEEIELETAPHVDFYSGRPDPASINSSGSSRGTMHKEEQKRIGPSAPSGSSLRPAASSSSAGGGFERSPSISPSIESQFTPLPLSTMQRSESEGSVNTSSDGAFAHSTLKILLHAIQLRNVPLEEHDEQFHLVKQKTYLRKRPILQSTPVHIVVANEHTLITVRPWVEPLNCTGTQAQEDAARANGSLEGAEPNQLFDDLINTLSDTDPTSSGSSLGLTTALQLMMRILEDIVDQNWSYRDLMKELKIYLGDHSDRLSSSYYTMILNDFDRVASSVVRLLKPLVAAVGALCEHPGDTTQSERRGGRHHALGSSGRGGAGSMGGATSGVQQMMHESARATYLASVHPAMRMLHRSLLRQQEQANLTVTLLRGLQEQFVQRGRDKANDTLYLLTVVTTIVTPLQIMAGVYGMNFDNIPEYHHENSYFW